MTNIEKYNSSFIEAFEVEEKDLETLKYQDIESWDSIGHMTLIALLEESFEIMMETDDIIDFSSYQIGKDIVKKYNIAL